MKKSSCCVIIVTYNGEKWIERNIQSILGGTFVPDIYVVDNGSSDKTIDILKSFPELILIANNENLGFGGGNNLALKQAYKDGYEYFFLVNQDTYLFEDTVATLVREVQKFGERAIFSPIHLDGQANHLDDLFGSRFLKNQDLFADHERLLEDFNNNDLKGHYEVKFVNAAFWMLRRKTLEEVGVFHPFFFHYGEDTNYWDRARLLGYKMIVFGQARACHDWLRTPRRKLSARPFFEKELLKTLLNENEEKPKGKIWRIIFSGLKILLQRSEFWKIPGYLFFCVSKGQDLKKKVKFVKPNLGVR